LTKKKLGRLALVLGLLTITVYIGGCLPSENGEDGTGGFITSIWPMLIFIVFLFGLMYFIMIRPQRRQQRERQDLADQLQKGDRVITAGGIYGQIDSISDDNVVLKIESGGTIRVARTSITTKQGEPQPRTG